MLHSRRTCLKGANSALQPSQGKSGTYPQGNANFIYFRNATRIAFYIRYLEKHRCCPKMLSTSSSPPAWPSFPSNAKATWGKGHCPFREMPMFTELSGKALLDLSQAARPGCQNSKRIDRHTELSGCRAAACCFQWSWGSKNRERLCRKKFANNNVLKVQVRDAGDQCERQTPLLVEKDVAFQECLENDKKFNFQYRDG